MSARQAFHVAKAKVLAAFGDWDMDAEKKNLEPMKYFTQNKNDFCCTLAIYEDVYLVKMVYRSAVSDREVDALNMREELTMMLLARDCCFQPIGRVYDEGYLCGFIVPFQSVATRQIFDLYEIDPVSINFEITPSPAHIIDALCSLVSRLHAKGIVQGSIQPLSILFCPTTGELRLCSFGKAGLPPTPGIERYYAHVPYSSPFRQVMLFEVPRHETDDLYAVGIAIWELYLSRQAYSDLRDMMHEEVLVDVIRCGFHPNLYEVDDLPIRRLIKGYLKAGNPPLPDTLKLQGEQCCIEADSIVYENCLADPPHTYSAFIECEACAQNSDSDEDSDGCPNYHNATQTMGHIDSPKCTICHPEI